jgi:ribosomal peptide maturation radical SAM protein 1
MNPHPRRTPLPDAAWFPLGGDVLIVVPPFGDLYIPALGAHAVQASAQAAGFRVRVLYANLLFAAAYGEEIHQAICFAATRLLLGECVFAEAAYGVPPLGRRNAADASDAFPAESYRSKVGLEITGQELGDLAARVPGWVSDLAEAVLRLGFPVVGCSTMHWQTAASIALLRRLKGLRPELVTLLGGPSCDGEVADGLFSLQAGIDYVFSGESDASFPQFLRDLRSGTPPPPGIVRGEPCPAMDRLPTPDFSDYYDQLQRCFPGAEVGAASWLPYEGSRGCWWGQKHHCTFCGLNDHAMAFRAKSPARVVSDLRDLMGKHPSRRLQLVDSILPHDCYRELLPRLAEEVPGLRAFCFVKANLSLAQVLALKRAGVALVQPGIEALSSSLLRRMDKGVSARQNLAALRYARAVGLDVSWNLLHGFPGDEVREYEDTRALVPLLSHLYPPSGFFEISIDRFAPYFTDPARYGVRQLRPWPAYSAILPADADTGKIAIFFDADYPSAARANPALIDDIAERVAAWQKSWQAPNVPPVLHVRPLSDEQWMLLDTRGLPGAREIQFLTRQQAALVLVGDRHASPVDVAWALDRKLIVECEATLVPLATAEPDVLLAFENELQRSKAPGARVTGPVSLVVLQ